jgi:hypothetical protein
MVFMLVILNYLIIALLIITLFFELRLIVWLNGMFPRKLTQVASRAVALRPETSQSTASCVRAIMRR